MSNWTLRVLTRLAFALFINAAEAGPIASAPLTLERLSLVQLVQFQSFGTNYCTYSDGWNGRGWYRCGDQWNTSFGWAGPFGSSGLSGPAVRRHPPSVTAPKRVYPGYQPSKGRNTGSGVAFPTFGRAPGFRHSGAGGVHVAPNFRVGPARCPRSRWRRVWQCASVSRRRRSAHRRTPFTRRCWLRISRRHRRRSLPCSRRRGSSAHGGARLARRWKRLSRSRSAGLRTSLSHPSFRRQ